MAIDLDEAERIGKAATEGPWDAVMTTWDADRAVVCQRNPQHGVRQYNVIFESRMKFPDGLPYASAAKECDADFVAYARNNWQSLIDEVKQARVDCALASLALSAITKDDALECRCGQDPYTDGEPCPKCYAVEAHEALRLQMLHTKK